MFDINGPDQQRWQVLLRGRMFYALVTKLASGRWSSVVGMPDGSFLIGAGDTALEAAAHLEKSAEQGQVLPI